VGSAVAGLFDTVVDPDIHRLLRRERELLVQLREVLEREQSDEHRRVEELLIGLEDLFTIVVVGEFNAGKSSLINALFGDRLRVEGPVPVDDRISILRFSDSAAGTSATPRQLSDFVTEHHYSVEFLRNITLVDTPGTNSIVQRHQEITQDYIPRADLVLFVTSIDRPLSESERQFLQFIREWGKKVVFVLNKIDTKSEGEVQEVLEYLRTNIRSIFGFDPVIFPVASKRALEAKRSLDKEELKRSRFDILEDYIFRVLSEKERVRIKLQAPLDTAVSLTRKQQQLIESRRSLLSSDMEKIDRITKQLTLAEADLRSNFRQFTARIDNLMMELERRGVEFLERYMRIAHVMLLRNATRFREEFERQVFQEWEGSIDRTIQESVDWLVKENMKLWSGTVDEFHRRTEMEVSANDLVGRVGREFAYNRDEVYTRIKGEAERRMGTYNVAIESRKLIDNAMQAVFQSVGLGAGALGLGYLITTAFSSVAIDVTGLTAATMLLVTSFLILPYKRSKAKTEFHQRIEQLRVHIREALDRESGAEIERMISHITSAFEPYRRFHATESAKIEEFGRKISQVEASAREIAAEITRLA
jgi:small GTP-binding protein